jgi:DNA-binding LacI/PurR family transcriptional regulator
LGDTTLPEAAQRYEGYVQAHRQRGIAIDPRLHVPSAFTAVEAQAAMQNFLKQGLVCDGLFAASDLIAMNAMGVLTAHGFEVPKDVSVVGYDDVEVAAHCHPPLTTVRQPIDMAGTVMIECLLAKLHNQKVESRILPTSLKIRASTCAVA